MNTHEIGQQIKRRRQELNINQQTLSYLSGVGINTIVAIERGTGNPSMETLMKIMQILGLQIKIEV